MKFITDLFESMEARRKREERAATIFFIGGIIAILILGVIVMIVINILNAVETANVNNIYGETYASTCQSMPAGQDSDSNLTDAAPPRQMLLLIANTQRRHPWHDDLPAQWRAETEDEVSLIGCVEEESILIETCEYSRDSARPGDTYTVRIKREQSQATVVLVNPTTARRIDSLTVTGAEPPPCPEDDGEFSSGEQRGEPLQWQDFAAWAENYIFS